MVLGGRGRGVNREFMLRVGRLSVVRSTLFVGLRAGLLADILGLFNRF